MSKISSVERTPDPVVTELFPGADPSLGMPLGFWGKLVPAWAAEFRILPAVQSLVRALRSESAKTLRGHLITTRDHGSRVLSILAGHVLEGPYLAEDVRQFAALLSVRGAEYISVGANYFPREGALYFSVEAAGLSLATGVGVGPDDVLPHVVAMIAQIGASAPDASIESAVNVHDRGDVVTFGIAVHR